MPQDRTPPPPDRTVAKIAVSSFVIQALTLYSSEFFNSVYNNRFDSLGLDLAGRLPYIFKPTVVGVFLAAYVFQLVIMLLTLRPMLSYLSGGKDYAQARLAAVKL